MDSRDFLPLALQGSYDDILSFKGKPTNIEVSPKVIALTIKLLRELAEDGNGDACRILAYTYTDGLFGFSTDKGQAKHYIEKGAHAGEPHCQYQMGLVLEGKILSDELLLSDPDDDFISIDFDTKDEVMAQQWYQLAANQGLAAAREKLLLT